MTRECIRPGRSFHQVSFEVDDGPLPTSVRQLGVITHIDEVEHDRARAKVERDILADEVVLVALDAQLLKPASLDAAHSNRRSRTAAADHNGVRPERTLRDDLREVIDVRDVVDPGLRRDGHARILRNGRHLRPGAALPLGRPSADRGNKS